MIIYFLKNKYTKMEVSKMEKGIVDIKPVPQPSVSLTGTLLNILRPTLKPMGAAIVNHYYTSLMQYLSKDGKPIQ
jgi:hypothetical protein